jgi:2-succinyl-6-hydroxy-2,4-cyclohexadiene-1-carboxylate synthase
MTRVVFLHGFLGQPEAWAPVVERVSELRPDVEPIAPSLPGHGKGAERVVGPGFDDALDAMVDALSTGPALWVGYSMGARLALGVAARHPAIVRGLVLVSSHLGLPTDLERARRAAEDAAFADLADRGIEAMVAAHVARPVLASQRGLPACLRDALDARRRDHEPEAIASALRALGLGAMPDLRAGLARLDVPVLTLAGADDPTYVALAREAARLARGEVTIVPNASHDVVLEDPEQVSAAVVRALVAIDGTRRPSRVTESRA